MSATYVSIHNHIAHHPRWTVGDDMCRYFEQSLCLFPFEVEGIGFDVRILLALVVHTAVADTIVRAYATNGEGRFVLHQYNTHFRDNICLFHHRT